MKTEFNIAVFPGDGIGPEVIAEAIKVIKIIELKLGLKINLQLFLVEHLEWVLQPQKGLLRKVDQ